MNNNKVLQGVILAMLIMVGGLRFSYANAQENSNVIQLSIGETLEMTTDTTSQGAEFSWILTKDRKFLSGQRTRFFQTRLAEIGTYTLDVSIQNPRTGENALHTFSIIVGDILPTLLPPEANPRDLALRAIAETQPTLVNGALYVLPQGGIVKIDSTKSEGKIDKYWIDLDSTIDSDNDGILTNDHDNIGTFSEKAGTPIYLYALPKQTPRSIHLSVQDLSGAEPSTLELPLQFASPPAVSTASPIAIDGNIAIEKNDLTIRVSVGDNGSPHAGRQLLYEWDFGDKNRSLLDSPTHSYVSAGTYSISLAIRDITTGEVLQNFSQTIQVTSDITSSSTSSMSSVSSSSDVSENGTSSFSLWGVLKVLFIIICLLALALSLYAAIAWVKRRSTQSIQQTLEKIEEKIVKNNQDDDEKKIPAPMNLKKDTVELSPKKNIVDVAQREKSKTDFQTKQRTNETPTATAGPVPAWLKKTPEPTPTPAAKPPQKKPEENKAPVSKEQSAPPSAPKTAAVPPPAPAPKVPMPAPAATKPPVPAPAAKNEPTASEIKTNNSLPDGPVPAWLKPSAQEKSPNPSTSVSQQKPEKPVVAISTKQELVTTPAAKPASVTPVHPSTPPPTLAQSGDIPKADLPEPKADSKKESTYNSDPTIAIIKADSLNEK